MTKLQDVWAAGKSAANGWLALPGSHLAEVMAHQGWDALTIDLQHSSIDVAAAVPMLQAMAAADVTPIVRVPWNEPSVMMRVLDAGAYGIICPMVNSREDAENFVSACRYPPAGMRSNGAYRGMIVGGSDYQKTANSEIVTFAMIETREGMANLKEIAETPGLDALYIGPTDLAFSHGHPPVHNNFDGPVAALIAEILAAAHAAGIKAGVHATNTEYAAKMMEDGFDLVTPTSDLRMIQAAAPDVLAGLSGVGGR
ncbi:MAG: 2,4-dihydroxyhept-2-ene-1,7-dioic acid aldolase [Alphaproteobacteria bacterium]|jgi:4-hydroxy-2-oxoheptanedioate aldolase|nr:2,4-dihydroxyhept-2-ene-1,7-dioic acid aldolase [Alphaproteobacteria bacterium]